MVKRLLLVPIMVALIAVTMLPDHGLSQAADKVTLQLKWVTQAQFAGTTPRRPRASIQPSSST